tara:strand:- start:969 stop:1121 length:153 start_codon:yes stop_codon:yes gene_type:complete
MHIFIIPLGFILWCIAYKAKPTNKDDVFYLLEEENIVKRNKLLNIINGSL